MAAHRIPYIATASVSHPEDFYKKMKKAKDIKGTRFFHVFAPCPTGWKSRPDDSVKLARMAVQNGLFSALRDRGRREGHAQPQAEGEEADHRLHPAPGAFPPSRVYRKLRRSTP
jgi:pyruvate/2-oxoacid:ferredoxin oxidoreductase beta subunit